jgi:long-subunit fatty acid transport protein
MKRLIITLSAALLGSSAAFAQGQLDAYKYSQTDVLGTTRYMSMGGAFGALGGDISVLGANPAGLAVYRSSEIVTTLSLNNVSTKTNMSGLTGKADRIPFSFDNIGYVGFFPTGAERGVVGWNVGFSYQRVKDFNRSYYSHDTGEGLSSLSDYVAERAAGYSKDVLGSENAYYSADFLPVLGYQSGMIDYLSGYNDLYGSAMGEEINNSWQNYPFTGRELSVRESGGISQYNFAFGMNLSDRLYLGLNLAVTDFQYLYRSSYAEDFGADLSDGTTAYLTLDNWMKTEGAGFGVNVGAIFRPFNFLRIGAAYNSPTWYKMTDRFDATAEVNSGYWPEIYSAVTPEGAIADYSFRTPGRWLLSAAAILGQAGLLSVDYEITDYRNMFISERDGTEGGHAIDNQDVRDNFKTTGTLRVGGELRVTPQFSVRAGAAWINSPLNTQLKDGHTVVYPVGTIPHYTLDKGITNYSVGVGYRFTPNFYMDLGCQFKQQKEDLYYMPNMPADPDTGIEIFSQAASLKTNSTRISLTLGYKF